MSTLDKFKEPTALFVDEQKQTHRHQTPEEILFDRNGKIEKHELYFSSKEMLNMYPNGYSVLIKHKNSRKHVNITVYKGIGDVTSSFFTNKTNRKVKALIAMKFLEYIEGLE